MSLFRPPSTPGVVLARLQTLRPFEGKSLTARMLIVSEILALSVSSIGDEATTVIDSFNWPTFIDDVGADHLVVGDLDAAHLGRLEAGERHGDLVGAGAHELDGV